MKMKKLVGGIVVVFVLAMALCISGIAGSGNYISKDASVYAATTTDTRTGVYKAKYAVNGKTTTEWCYLKKGKVQYSYTGFASNSSGWWYVEKGKVTFKKNDVIKGTVKNQSGWWFVKESKVQFVDSVEKNSLGWWKITDGKVDFTYTGVAKNSSGWWYIKNGKVDFNYTGLAANENGTWYIEKGKVDFDTNSWPKKEVVKGKVNGKDGWWYVKNGKVDLGYTGAADNSNGTWYVEKGRVTFSTTGVVKSGNNWIYVKNSKFLKETNSVEKNNLGWWKITDGFVDFDYTGIAKNQYGYWYCENGKVCFGREAFVDGEVNGKYDAWYVKGGKVQTDFTGTIITNDYKVTVKKGEVVAAVLLKQNVQTANEVIVEYDGNYKINRYSNSNGSWKVLETVLYTSKGYNPEYNAFRYDSNGRLLKTLSFRSDTYTYKSTYEYEYDKSGNLSKSYGGDIVRCYDKYGNLTSFKNYNSEIKYTNSYDSSGRLIKVSILEDVDSYSDPIKTIAFKYGKNSNLSEVSTLTYGGTKANYSYTYDNNGRLSGIKADSWKFNQSVEYDKKGHIIGFKWGDSYITTFKYDVFGNLIQTKHFEAGTSMDYVCVYIIR